MVNVNALGAPMQQAKYVSSLTFTPDGKQLIASGDRIRI